MKFEGLAVYFCGAIYVCYILLHLLPRCNRMFREAHPQRKQLNLDEFFQACVTATMKVHRGDFRRAIVESYNAFTRGDYADTTVSRNHLATIVSLAANAKPKWRKAREHSAPV